MSRFTDPIIGQAWHADGTPFSDEDYRKAGMHVPTPEQARAWAEADREREREKKDKG